MHLAIISTTIRGEGGYLDYDRLAARSRFSPVSFVIAGDLKSPPFDTRRFKCAVEYLEPPAQEKYRSSPAIGWDRISRRNIALLRAIELKPDCILTIDDDNIPPEDYFDQWYAVLTQPARKVVVRSRDIEGPYWHNYLASADGDIELYPRGFPIPFRGQKATAVTAAKEPIPSGKIGLFQGISLGDPDIDAMTRIVYPKPLPLNAIGDKNYCLKDIWSPYNTQNTVYSKKLFPLAFTWPHCGRFEDIYASFVWQKFLFNNDMYVHVGDALNRQNRGRRNDLPDLKKETEGYLHAHEVWRQVNRITEREAMAFARELSAFTPASPLELGRGPQAVLAAVNPIAARDPFSFIGRLQENTHPIISRHRDFFRAYLQDLERVL